MHGTTVFSSPESFVHAAIGAASFVVSPYIFVPYAVYQYSNAGDKDAPLKCPNYAIQGVEYGLGYFGALLAYETFTSLSY